MTCQSCSKRPASVKVGGRVLCTVCARDEVLSRFKSILYRSKVLGWRKSVIVVIPEGWFPLKDVVLTLTKKSCLSCELSVSLELLNLHDLSEIIEKIILLASQRSVPVITPFTAEFFAAYLLYSLAKGMKDHLPIVPPISEFSSSKVVSPLSTTTLAELEAFGRFELRFEDQLFDEVFQWARAYFRDSPEQARAYWKSFSLFKSARCEDRESS